MLIPRFVRRFLRRLGPYPCLLFLAVPLSIIEPLKLVALFILGDGHFVVGLLIMACAYGASLFVTEQLFVVVKPKLMTLHGLPEFGSVSLLFVNESYAGSAASGHGGIGFYQDVNIQIRRKVRTDEFRFRQRLHNGLTLINLLVSEISKSCACPVALLRLLPNTFQDRALQHPFRQPLRR